MAYTCSVCTSDVYILHMIYIHILSIHTLIYISPGKRQSGLKEGT